MYLIRKISPWQEKGKLFPFGNPVVGMFRTYDEAKETKNLWEIKALKENGITNNYEYWDVDCSEELIKLNHFLKQKHGIEIINPDREQNDTYINTNDIIPTNFPEYFESEDYLAIQKEMDRYHYEIVKSENIGKYIIIFNQKLIGILNDEMGIARSLKYQTFNSIEEAEKEVDFQLNKIYNNEKGTFGLVGAIKKSDFTEETNTLLNEIGEIRYDSEDYATGQRFMSENEISEIENGIKKLKELLNSVGKKIYEIGYINEK